MTATDRAFIRVFDQDADQAELAPHVLFAARGVQMSKTIAVADALAEQRKGSGSPRSMGPKTVRSKPATMDAARPTAKPRLPQKPDRESRSTYLPSAYRGLVGMNDSHSGPEGPRIVAFDEPRTSGTRAETSDTNTHDRNPVSNSESAAPACQAFRPALEVDALRWPVVVERLLDQHARELEIVCDALRQRMDKEQRVIVLQSPSRGAGCTTVALASARLLAGEGYSVAVVDAEFDRPGLAAAVGLVVEEGWERTLAFGAPLAESVIQSLADGIAVVPLASLPEGQLACATLQERFAGAMHELAESFDVVLVDAGCSAERFAFASTRSSPLAAADACVLVYAFDPNSGADEVPQVDLSLPLIGVVENLAFTGAA